MDCLSFLPRLMIPFLSKTHPPVSDHCSLSQGLENSNLFGCFPKHSGKDCTPFECLLCVYSPFTTGFWCSIASMWLMTRQLGPVQQTSECFPLPPR